MDHYNSVGWVIGGTKVRMKDWHCACRLWDRRERKHGRAILYQPQASLFSLQAQLRTIENELEAIIYPGGSAFKVPIPEHKLDRYQELVDQRRVIKGKIDNFAAAV